MLQNVFSFTFTKTAKKIVSVSTKIQLYVTQARAGRTTLVVAHRLSTIKTADIIVGFNQGVATERGTHSELMAKQGIYHQLVTHQV